MFFEEYLQDLRRERFHASALARYFLQVGRRVRADILANPAAARSVWIVALGFFLATFAAAASLALLVERHLANEFLLWTSVAILGGFGLVSLSVGVMRDRAGYALSALPAPCALTLLRLALIPGVCLFLLDGHLALATAVFGIAALTDIVDGWAARRFGQETQLGVVLDPLVDIAFNLSLFAALAAAGLMKPWVFAAAGVRYGLLLVGGAYLYLFHGPVRIEPTLFGRLSGVVMTMLVFLLIGLAIGGGPLAERLSPLTSTALGVLLSGAVVQVLVMGWYNLRLLTGEARAARRVIDVARWGGA
jgi:cardiolipin synthase